jgi:hypothetical protein
MILVTYGDAQAAASHTKKPFTWANEDHWHTTRGHRAHPDNIPLSFGYRLSQLMHIGFHAGMLHRASVQDIWDSYNKLKETAKLVVVVSWASEHIVDLDKIEAFSLEMGMRGTPHCFVNGGARFKHNGNKHWLWDPSKQTVAEWGKSKGLVGPEGYLTALGHTYLANDIFLHLTKQLPNLIVVA